VCVQQKKEEIRSAMMNEGDSGVGVNLGKEVGGRRPARRPPPQQKKKTSRTGGRLRDVGCEGIGKGGEKKRIAVGKGRKPNGQLKREERLRRRMGFNRGAGRNSK